MQNASEEREKTRKQVVTLIRSLLISTKGGVPIEKINRKKLCKLVYVQLQFWQATHILKRCMHYGRKQGYKLRFVTFQAIIGR